LRLLIVEDSTRLRESLADGLTSSGYAVDAVADGQQGLAYARATEYDLIVLDVMLPELDGLSVLDRFRKAGGRSPVLLLSARDRVEHRVEGLRAGADDYLVKPFAFAELLARVEALCRRSRGVPAPALRFGALEADLAAREARTLSGRVPLTPREFAVLEFLCLNAGRVVSRADLEEHIYDANHQVWSNAVDGAIAGIRKKLGAAGITGLIETRRGSGYLIRPPGESRADQKARA